MVKTKIVIKMDLIIVLVLAILIILTDVTAIYAVPSTIRTLSRLGCIFIFLCELVRQREVKMVTGFFLLIGTVMIYYARSWSAVTIARNYFLNVLECSTFIIAGVYFLKNRNSTNTKPILYFVLILTLVNAITTLIGIQNYPYAIREIGRGSSYANGDESVVNFYRLKNIAGWAQLYGIVYITMSLSVIFKRTRKLIILVLLVLLNITIIASQITIATVLSIGMTIVLLWPDVKTTKSFFTQVALIGVTIPLVVNFQWIVLRFIELLKLYGFDFIAMKVNDAYTLLFFGQAKGSAESRIGVYEISLKSILRSPIIGNFLSSKDAETVYGFHSELLDMIAFGGIIMLAVLILFFIKYISLIKRWGGFMQRDLLLIFFAFVILFSLNPVFLNPPVFMAVFLIPALTKDYLGRKSSEKKSRNNNLNHSIHIKQ